MFLDMCAIEIKFKFEHSYDDANLFGERVFVYTNTYTRTSTHRVR